VKGLRKTANFEFWRGKSMKKKILFGLLALTLVALPWSGACAPAPPPVAETIKLGFVHIFPPTHYSAVDQFPRYFKMVEEATGGKYILDIEYYPVGTLLGGAEIYDGVVKRIADSGQSAFPYNPGRFPVILALSEPGIAPPESADAAAYTVWEFYNKFKPKELEDTKVLYLYATGPAWLHSKSPIRSVEDMKGLLLRVTGAGIGGAKAVEAEPVAMPMGEVYAAAQKGIIEALVSPAETLDGWKHHELFDYSTFVPDFYSSFFYIVMNLDKWNSLPKDLQAAFDAVAEEAMKEAGQIWQYQQKKGMDVAKASPGGHEFLYLPDAEAAKLRELMKPLRAAYIAELNAKGLPGEEIANEAAKIMEKYNAKKYEPWTP